MDGAKKEKKLMRLIGLVLFLFIFRSILNAQVSLKVNSDFGHSEVSEGVFIKTGVGVAYAFKNTIVETNFRNEIISNNKSLLSGLKLSALQKLTIRNYDFNATILLLETTFSNFVRETNYGLIVSSNKKHFEYNLGVGFKTIGYTKKAMSDYEINRDEKLYENFNLLYNFNYILKKSSSDWNAGVSFTNYDHFIINQSTNPMMNIFGYYKINESVRLKAELWYKTAGALNLHVNYFGWFFRPGIIWEL